MKSTTGPLSRRLSRILVVVAAALLTVMPVWAAARAIAAVYANAEGPAGPGVFQEEEVPVVAVHRAHPEIPQRAGHRGRRAVVSGAALRHRVERESAALARRWAKYQAPPRAPPHRLLI